MWVFRQGHSTTFFRASLLCLASPAHHPGGCYLHMRARSCSLSRVSSCLLARLLFLITVFQAERDSERFALYARKAALDERAEEIRQQLKVWDSCRPFACSFCSKLSHAAFLLCMQTLLVPCSLDGCCRCCTRNWLPWCSAAVFPFLPAGHAAGSVQAGGQGAHVSAVEAEAHQRRGHGAAQGARCL